MSVLGLCSLLQCQSRPAVVQSNAQCIVPLIIYLLELLVAAYKSELIIHLSLMQLNMVKIFTVFYTTHSTTTITSTTTLIACVTIDA